MDFIPSSHHGPVTRTHEIPARYLPYRLPAAAPLYTKGNSYDYLTQITAGDGCSSQYNNFSNENRDQILIHPYVPRPIITMHFTLLGHIRCELMGYGEAWLHEGFYHLFYVPGGMQHNAWFTPGDYLSFHLDFSQRFLRRLATVYPEVKEVLTKSLTRSDEGVQQHGAHITQHVRDIIADIFLCPPDEPGKTLHLAAGILQLLLLYVNDNPDDVNTTVRNRRQLFREIAGYAAAHLDYPHTVQSLSREFGISEVTLRNLFRLHAGQTFRKWIYEQRMEKAMDLLETGMPVGKVAIQLAYTDFSNFDRAFRRKYGRPPGHFRP